MIPSYDSENVHNGAVVLENTLAGVKKSNVWSDGQSQADARRAFVIGAGGGKTTLAARYPDKFVDVENMIAADVKGVLKGMRAQGKWREHDVLYNNIISSLDLGGRIPLVHTPDQALALGFEPVVLDSQWQSRGRDVSKAPRVEKALTDFMINNSDVKGAEAASHNAEMHASNGNMWRAGMANSGSSAAQRGSEDMMRMVMGNEYSPAKKNPPPSGDPEGSRTQNGLGNMAKGALGGAVAGGMAAGPAGAVAGAIEGAGAAFINNMMPGGVWARPVDVAPTGSTAPPVHLPPVPPATTLTSQPISAVLAGAGPAVLGQPGNGVVGVGTNLSDATVGPLPVNIAADMTPYSGAIATNTNTGSPAPTMAGTTISGAEVSETSTQRPTTPPDAPSRSAGPFVPSKAEVSSGMAGTTALAAREDGLKQMADALSLFRGGVAVTGGLGSVTLDKIPGVAIAAAAGAVMGSTPIDGANNTIPIDIGEAAEPVANKSQISIAISNTSSTSAFQLANGTPLTTQKAVFYLDSNKAAAPADIRDVRPATFCPKQCWAKLTIVSSQSAGGLDTMSLVANTDLTQAAAQIVSGSDVSALGALLRTSGQTFQGQTLVNAAANLQSLSDKSASSMSILWRLWSNIAATMADADLCAFTNMFTAAQLSRTAGPTYNNETRLGIYDVNNMRRFQRAGVSVPGDPLNGYNDHMAVAATVLGCTSFSSGATWKEPQFKIIPQDPILGLPKDIGFNVVAITQDAFYALNAGKQDRTALPVQPNLGISSQWQEWCRLQNASGVPYNVGSWGDTTDPEGTAICPVPIELLEQTAAHGIERLQHWMFAQALPVCPAARVTCIDDGAANFSPAQAGDPLSSSKDLVFARNNLSHVVDINRTPNILIVVCAMGNNAVPNSIAIAPGLSVPVWDSAFIQNSLVTTNPTAVQVPLKSTVFYNNNTGLASANNDYPAGTWSTRKFFVASDASRLATQVPHDIVSNTYSNVADVTAAYMFLAECMYSADLRSAARFGGGASWNADSPNPSSNTGGTYMPDFANRRSKLHSPYWSPVPTTGSDFGNNKLGEVYRLGGYPFGSFVQGATQGILMSVPDIAGVTPDPVIARYNSLSSGQDSGDYLAADNIAWDQNVDISPCGVPRAGSLKYVNGFDNNLSHGRFCDNDTPYNPDFAGWSGIDRMMQIVNATQNVVHTWPSNATPPGNRWGILDMITTKPTHHISSLNYVLNVMLNGKLLSKGANSVVRNPILPGFFKNVYFELRSLSTIATAMVAASDVFATRRSVSPEMAADVNIVSTLAQRFSEFVSYCQANAFPQITPFANAVNDGIGNMQHSEVSASCLGYSADVAKLVSKLTLGLVSVGTSPFAGQYPHVSRPGLASFAPSREYFGFSQNMVGLGAWTSSVVNDANQLRVGLLPYMPPIRRFTYELLRTRFGLSLNKREFAYFDPKQSATSLHAGSVPMEKIMNPSTNSVDMIPNPSLVPVAQPASNPGYNRVYVPATRIMPTVSSAMVFNLHCAPVDNGDFMYARDTLSRAFSRAVETQSNIGADIWTIRGLEAGKLNDQIETATPLPDPWPVDAFKGGKTTSSFLRIFVSRSSPARIYSANEADITGNNYRIISDIVQYYTGSPGPFAMLPSGEYINTTPFAVFRRRWFFTFGRTLPQSFFSSSTLGSLALGHSATVSLITSENPSIPLSDMRATFVTTLQSGPAISYNYGGAGAVSMM